jgi:NADH:ubiquinone oxidoreductase subunit E
MRLRSLARRCRDRRHVVIPALYTAKAAFGDTSAESLAPICELLGVTPDWLAAASRDAAPERDGTVVVRICDHENCALRNGRDVLDEARRSFLHGEGSEERVQTSACGRFRVESVGCLGACTAPAAVEINSELYDHVDREVARWLFDALAKAPGLHP